jgi:phosphoribosylformylglycinamidine synthase subunit PurS
VRRGLTKKSCRGRCDTHCEMTTIGREMTAELFGTNALVALESPSILLQMKVHVVVKPKEAVLDPQGAAVRDAMHHLGVPEVRSVRIGKYMEIELDGNGADLEKRLHGLCRDLLSNPVIEDYELKKNN